MASRTLEFSSLELVAPPLSSTTTASTPSNASPASIPTTNRGRSAPPATEVIQSAPLPQTTPLPLSKTLPSATPLPPATIRQPSHLSNSEIHTPTPTDTISSLPSTESGTRVNSRDLENRGAEKSNPIVKFKILRSYTEIFNSSHSPTGEQPKVAIRQGLRGNWIKLAPHIVAIGITLGVCQLSFCETYWMDLLAPGKHLSIGLTQPGALNFLQLAAKLHELVILTSISSIVLHVAQIQLAGSPGLPLGMVANAFELGSAQFLRRKSFWSAIWTTDPATGKKFPFRRFWLLSLSATLLVLLSGPSSAIAVIPTLNYFQVPSPKRINGTEMPFYIWNNSAELWPKNLTSANYPTDANALLWETESCVLAETSFSRAYCPGGDYGSLTNWAESLLSPVGNKGSNLTIRHNQGDSQRVITTNTCSNSTFHGHSSGASLNSFLNSALTLYWNHILSNFHGTVLNADHPRLTVKSDVLAPVVETICQTYLNSDPYFTGENPEVIPNMTFPTFDNLLQIPVPDRTFRFAHDLQAINISLVEMLDDPLAPSLGSVFLAPFLDGTILDNGTLTVFQSSMTVVCSIYSQWIPVDVWFEPSVEDAIQYSITGDAPNTCLNLPNAGESKRESINTTISSEYADAINQPMVSDFHPDSIIPRLQNLWEHFILIGDDYIPGGASLLIPYDFDGSNLLTGSPLNGYNDTIINPAKLVSQVLSGVIVNGLARIDGNGYDPYSTSIFLQPNRNDSGNLTGLLLDSSYKSGEQIDLNTADIADVASWVKLEFAFSRYGYGYSWRGSPTVQFGITVLLIHSTVALIHTCYLLTKLMKSKWRGGFPKAWETIPELFVLAVNSRPSDKLKNTSAGIKEASTWGQVVAVREHGRGQHLELTVGRDEMDRSEQPRVGVAYG